MAALRMARGFQRASLISRFAPLQCARMVSTTEGKDKWVGLDMQQDFFAKNKKLARPMSPHLTIYSFPLPAILSISHRISGVGLTAAISAGAIGLMVHPLEYYLSIAQAMEISPTLLTAGKFTFVFPFTYHSINGVRHLVWDLAKGLKLPSIYATGYVTVAISAGVSLWVSLL